MWGGREWYAHAPAQVKSEASLLQFNRVLCVTQSGHWEPDLDLLQEGYVILTTEPRYPLLK